MNINKAKDQPLCRRIHVHLVCEIWSAEIRAYGLGGDPRSADGRCLRLQDPVDGESSAVRVCVFKPVFESSGSDGRDGKVIVAAARGIVDGAARVGKWRTAAVGYGSLEVGRHTMYARVTIGIE